MVHAPREPQFSDEVGDYQRKAVQFADELIGASFADPAMRAWGDQMAVDYFVRSVLHWLDQQQRSPRRRVRDESQCGPPRNAPSLAHVEGVARSRRGRRGALTLARRSGDLLTRTTEGSPPGGVVQKLERSALR
jgi:hypothetical protein